MGAGEQEIIYSSKVKYNGIVDFKEFYQFCYDWLKEETGLDIVEGKYNEKIVGDAKELDIKWEGTKRLTDYFKMKFKVDFLVLRLKEIEIEQEGKKIKTNKGEVKLIVKGILMRDYQGKFDKSAWNKFTRGIYEKWVIPSRVDQFEDQVASKVDEFLGQAKAWLDMEGKSRHQKRLA